VSGFRPDDVSSRSASDAVDPVELNSTGCERVFWAAHVVVRSSEPCPRELATAASNGRRCREDSTRTGLEADVVISAGATKWRGADARRSREYDALLMLDVERAMARRLGPPPPMTTARRAFLKCVVIGIFLLVTCARIASASAERAVWRTGVSVWSAADVDVRTAQIPAQCPMEHGRQSAGLCQHDHSARYPAEEGVATRMPMPAAASDRTENGSAREAVTFHSAWRDRRLGWHLRRPSLENAPDGPPPRSTPLRR